MEEGVMRVELEEARVAVVMEEGAVAVMGWVLRAEVVDVRDACLAHMVGKLAGAVAVEDVVDRAAMVARGVGSRVEAAEDSRGTQSLAVERVVLASGDSIRSIHRS